MTQNVSVTVVVPTLGRPSLQALLRSLADSARHCGIELPRVVLVDDRVDAFAALDVPAEFAVDVVRGGGRGPAAARNAGWRVCDTTWIAFLDDDVIVTSQWLADLAADLEVAGAVAGVQGRIVVPLPAGRRPTDWERATAGLERGLWITADMAYRRDVLELVGGFDQRFPRAFREDADLALRVLDLGCQLTAGRRITTHPVRPSSFLVSVTQQRGNADDVLMQRLHGSGWRRRARAPLGRRPQHLVATAAGAVAVAALLVGRRRAAALAAGGWLALTSEFTWRRLRPGPGTPDEVARMAVTSVLIPPAATWAWLSGLVRHRSVQPVPAAPQSHLEPTPPPLPNSLPELLPKSRQRPAEPAAVLIDRDGTIVHDVPYNGDPALVHPVDGARDALNRLRSNGFRVAVISNQSGIGRGLLTRSQVDAVNQRVEELLGPFDGWFVCPHVPEDGCGCRKPAPGLVHQAMAALGVAAEQCVVIGDIGADMGAAAAAGAHAILVPTALTLAAEVRDAPHRANDLGQAVDLVLALRRSRQQQQPRLRPAAVEAVDAGTATPSLSGAR